MEKIATVIKYLVDYPHLLTDEIIQAGIEEGDVGLLDYLPREYLTPENIQKFIRDADNARYGSSFRLDRIPQALRTYDFCKFAVEAHISNYFHVPTEHRDRSFLELIVQVNPDSMEYYAQTPAPAWTRDLAYKGINALIRKETNRYSSFNSRYCNYSSRSMDMYLVQAFLSYVPDELKTGLFYRELFSKTKLKAKDILLLTPNKYRQDAFYLALAGVDFDLVPKSKYSYRIITVALKGKKTIRCFQDDKEILSQIESCLDNDLADVILEGCPTYFPELPKKFQTQKRLLRAIDKGEYYFLSDVDKKLLTLPVCKAIIKKKGRVPDLPQEVWTEEFVKFCMEHGGLGYWLRQMPAHLMTEELADMIMDKDMAYINYVPQQFIKPEHALKINRTGTDTQKERIPAAYYRDFIHETGLPKEFMGGEVSFTKFRDHAENYIYCRLGQTYLGYYWTDDGNRLVMTRRTSSSIYPQQIFERRISTFHTTWLEKIISDNDPKYRKPTVRKELKDLHINAYYALLADSKYKGVQIYRNVLLETTVNFAVSVKGSVMFCDTLDEMQEAIDNYLD